MDCFVAFAPRNDEKNERPDSIFERAKAHQGRHTPRRRGIQYAATFPFHHAQSAIASRPSFRGCQASPLRLLFRLAISDAFPPLFTMIGFSRSIQATTLSSFPNCSYADMASQA